MSSNKIRKKGKLNSKSDKYRSPNAKGKIKQTQHRFIGGE